MTEKRDEIATDLEIAMRSFEIELDRHAEGGSRAYHVSAEREFLLDTLGELHARALAIGDEAVIARVETVWQWLEGLRVPAAQRSTRIVVGADDPEMVDYLREVLTDDGYEVVGFDATQLTLERLAHVPADLFVLDVALDSRTPVGSGRDLLRQLREHALLGRIPIILGIPSGVEAGDEDTELAELAHLHLLERPIDVVELERLVARLRTSFDSAAAPPSRVSRA